MAADVLTKKQRSYCMSRIKGKDTKPELKVRNILWHLGLRYRTKGAVEGRPDIFFPKQKIAIFIDGCFWHGCPLHCNFPKINSEFWLKKISRNIDRDKRVNERLTTAGWKVLRIWEHEVENDLESCVNNIRAIVGR